MKDTNIKCWDWMCAETKIGECVVEYECTKLTDIGDALCRLNNDEGDAYCNVEDRVLCKINPRTYKVELIYNKRDVERIVKIKRL